MKLRELCRIMMADNDGDFKKTMDQEIVLMSDEEGNSFADHIEVVRYEGDKRAFLCPLNSKLYEDFIKD